MKKIFIPILALVLPTSLSAEPEQPVEPKKPNVLEKDETVPVEPGDFDMLAAFKKAKESIDYFLDHYRNPLKNEETFAVKYKVEDGEEVEYFWLSDIIERNGRFIGSINNTPQKVSNVKFGQKITFTKEQIVDWTFMRNDKMYGNFTVYPLLKKIPEDQAQQISAMLVPIELLEQEIAQFHKDTGAKKTPESETNKK